MSTPEAGVGVAASEGAEDFRIRYYKRQAANLVRDLRALADRVAAEAKPYSTVGVTGTPRYLAAAEQVNHSITWAVANMGAYRLFDAAHHADVAEAEANPPSADDAAVGRGVSG